ncbi:MAG: CHAP domain-containing protein [Polyangiaceae bacterium]
MLANLARLVSLATLGGVLLVGCSSAPEGDESASSAADELTTSRVDGNWSQFPNGEQCYAAIQNFYANRFHATVPHSTSHNNGLCRGGGACDLWVDAESRPDPNVWERIPNANGAKPELYDMIVYGPPAGENYGHVASVDHVENGNIYVIDDNYVGHLQKATRPHTVWVKAYGWYHLKSRGHEGGGTGVTCFPGGSYCGGDKVKGDANTLYRCNSAGNGATEIRQCPGHCSVNSGTDDSCK